MSLYWMSWRPFDPIFCQKFYFLWMWHVHMPLIDKKKLTKNGEIFLAQSNFYNSPATEGSAIADGMAPWHSEERQSAERHTTYWHWMKHRRMPMTISRMTILIITSSIMTVLIIKISRMTVLIIYQHNDIQHDCQQNVIQQNDTQYNAQSNQI